MILKTKLVCLFSVCFSIVVCMCFVLSFWNESKRTGFLDKVLSEINHPTNSCTKYTADTTIIPPSSQESRTTTGIKALYADHLFSNETTNDCITNEIIINVGRTILKVQETIAQNNSFSNDKDKHAFRERTFFHIYKQGKWGKGVDITNSGVQRSGPGSSLNAAQEANGILHTIINSLKLKLGKQTIKLLDVPCGDFQWMHRFLQTRNDIMYTGMDIVPDLISRHKNNFKNASSWRFILQDAVKTRLNEPYDIILMRHVIQHLPYNDIMDMLAHASNSGSKYLLATTFPGHKSSGDLLEPGGFRRVNLQIPPISLTPPLCIHKDGTDEFHGDQGYLGLWQLPLKKMKGCENHKICSYNYLHVPFYSCE